MTERAIAALGQFVHSSVSSATLPEDVRKLARDSIFDTVSVSVGATGSQELTDLALVFGSGEGSARDLLGRPSTLEHAAFVNGVLAHGLDYDDTHFPSVLHPSSVVVPAVLASATANPITKAQLVAAVAAGREVAVRLGLAGYDRTRRVSTFMERGFHATALCGCIAAAGVLAALQGLDPQRCGHAMAIASSMTGGLIEGNRAGGMVKPFHNAWAALTAVAASRLAAHGLTGSDTAIDGPYGFLASHVGAPWAAGWSDGLGDEWATAAVYAKAYPANHFLHAAIDAALQIRQRISTESIREIVVGLPAQVTGVVGEPHQFKVSPRTPYEARFSAQYVVAAALNGDGTLTLRDFNDTRVRDLVGSDLIRRIRVVADPEATSHFPNSLAARLTVQSRTGDRSTVWVDAVTGCPARPMTPIQARQKLTDCVIYAQLGEREDAISASLNAFVDPSGSAAADLHALLTAIGDGR
jgi:2-methylcitrate dehydratase PrpD